MDLEVEKHEDLNALERQALERVARLAHEIKNSMTSVSTFMQLLPSKWNDDHFRKSFYPVAREETLRVNRLINDMLELGKNQAAILVPVNIQDLVKEVIAIKSPLAEQRHLCIRTDLSVASPVIPIDQTRIKETINNLLTNAMEATPDEGTIDVRLDDVVLSSGRPAIRLEIQDSGSGIAPQLLTDIFNPYISTKKGSHHPGGTGLGLYIARRHIQAHGGTIEVENPEASGALFRVTLPVERRRV